MGRPLLLPHRVLTGLMYGEFSFLEREGRTVVVGVTDWCRHFRMSPAQLQSGLEYLELSGLIDQFNWKSHYAIVKTRPPEGYAHVTQE